MYDYYFNSHKLDTSTNLKHISSSCASTCSCDTSVCKPAKLTWRSKLPGWKPISYKDSTRRVGEVS
jgi:hypothetical protein